MLPESHKFKIVRKEKDPSFNIDSLDQYDLLLQFGPRDLQIGVVDCEEKRILLVEDYILPGANGIQDRLECYHQIFDDHHLLLANFWNHVKVSIKGRQFALVPASLFDPSNAALYLNINSPIKGRNEFLHTHTLEEMGITIVYVVETPVLEHLKSAYPKVEFKLVPHCASFIRGFRDIVSHTTGPVICLYLDRFTFHLVVFKNENLEYYNIFPINKFEDYSRYIRLVAGDQGLDLKTEHFLLWGYLSADSSHLVELKRDCPNLKLGGRPGGLKFGHAFDIIPDHQYFDLYSLNSL